MLTKFAVTNYKGFAERIELNISSPKNYEFNSYVIKNGVIKNGIIYGPNGSGKTNIGLAIFDIEYHLAPLKAKKRDYYNNFVYAGAPEKPIIFEYEFQFENKLLRYVYTKDKNGALQNEKLCWDGNWVFTNMEGTLKINEAFFRREYANQERLNSNANNISVINFLLAYYPLSEKHFLLMLYEFVNNMLWYRGVDIREFIGIETQENGNIEEFFINNNLVEEFSEFLQDVSGQKFHFVTPKKNDKTLWYKVGNGLLPFIETVSTGTKSLELLFFWMKRMGNSTFVFIDEFDAFYHFRLSYSVCKYLFKLPCQLFLSSHNTFLMSNELLRPDCNFIINNNHIKCLSDCTEKDLRFGHNIERIYRAGAFYEE